MKIEAANRLKASAAQRYKVGDFTFTSLTAAYTYSKMNCEYVEARANLGIMVMVREPNRTKIDPVDKNVIIDLLAKYRGRHLKGKANEVVFTFDDPHSSTRFEKELRNRCPNLEVNFL